MVEPVTGEGGAQVVVWDSEGTGGAWEKLAEAITGTVPGVSVTRQRTLEEFRRRLVTERRHIVAAVPVINGGRALAELSAIRELLWDVRVILVMPEEKNGILAEAHTFYPRYIAGLGGGFDDVAAIVQRMAGGMGGRRRA